MKYEKNFQYLFIKNKGIGIRYFLRFFYFAALSEEQKTEQRKAAQETLLNAGADLVINDLSELRGVVERLNKAVLNGLEYKISLPA